MMQWAIAIAVVLLIGFAGTFYFRNIRMRRDETAAGIVALSGVSWRTFIHMVLDALARRGYERVVDQESPSGDSDYVLEHDGRRWLLSCKHGSAFVLGKLVVNDLAKDIGLKNASGGFLVTQGRITDDARPVAALQNIELLDGPALWPELRGFMPEEQLAAIGAKASQAARQRVLLSWLFALLAGIVAFMLVPSSEPLPAATDVPVPATPTAPAARPVQATTEPPPATPASTDVPPLPGAPVQTPLEQQREDVASAISTLPDVDRAVWSSQSTLQVYLLEIDGDAFERICPLMERYPEIAVSRVQLTPPPGSGATVRFRQCRVY